MSGQRYHSGQCTRSHVTWGCEGMYLRASRGHRLVEQGDCCRSLRKAQRRDSQASERGRLGGKEEEREREGGKEGRKGRKEMGRDGARNGKREIRHGEIAALISSGFSVPPRLRVLCSYTVSLGLW